MVEPLSDSAITNWSMSNRPDYPRRIDVWDAMGRLPARWAVALRLTQVEGYTAPETAGILGCSVPRVYRLVQKGKRRMRELLAGYGQNGGGKVKMKIEVAPGYSVEYIESFYSSDEADALLRALLAVEMTPEVIRMYGRDTVTKRRSEQYGAEYRYNAKAKDSQEWTSLMLSIRERMESIAGPLDGGLVQVYPDGETGIGWHQDKGKPEIIVSLGLGAEREFSFGVGPASKCQEVWRMRLAHGSLLLIPAKTNEALKHRLPPAKRIKEPRVNVTLRRFPRATLVR